MIKVLKSFIKFSALLSLIVVPLGFALYANCKNPEVIADVFKSIGGALAIISSLFSFTLSWLIDSKNYLTKIYNIPEARRLYKKVNQRATSLVTYWGLAFFISVSILGLAFSINKKSFSLDTLYSYDALLAALLCTLSIAAFGIILIFFISAREILIFRNDLEELICEHQAEKPTFMK